jgi:hypothetical protein
MANTLVSSEISTTQAPAAGRQPITELPADSVARIRRETQTAINKHHPTQAPLANRRALLGRGVRSDVDIKKQVFIQEALNAAMEKSATAGSSTTGEAESPTTDQTTTALSELAETVAADQQPEPATAPWNAKDDLARPIVSRSPVAVRAIIENDRGATFRRVPAVPEPGAK